jgi:hypothetical protein
VWILKLMVLIPLSGSGSGPAKAVFKANYKRPKGSIARWRNRMGWEEHGSSIVSTPPCPLAGLGAGRAMGNG